MACPCRVQSWFSVFLFPHPLVNAPRSAGSGGSGLALSERSEFSQTPPGPSTAGCPVAQRRGRRHQGRLFLGYFLLAKQKKVTGKPGHPGTRPQQNQYRTIKNKIPTSSPKLNSFHEPGADPTAGTPQAGF